MSSANNSKMIVISSIAKPEFISLNRNNSKSSIKRENISSDNTSPCRTPTAQSKKNMNYNVLHMILHLYIHS